MKTLEQWWEEHPEYLSLTQVGQYDIKDVFNDGWHNALQTMCEDVEVSVSQSTTLSTFTRPKALVEMTDKELIDTALTLFLENSRERLRQQGRKLLIRAIEIERDDRKHGCRPTYTIDDIAYTKFGEDNE